MITPSHVIKALQELSVKVLTTTSQNWNKSFNHIEHRARKVGREGFVLSIPILTPKYLLPSRWIPVLFPTYSLLLRSEYSMIVPIHTTLKRSTELIRFVTLLFRDRRGAE